MFEPWVFDRRHALRTVALAGLGLAAACGHAPGSDTRDGGGADQADGGQHSQVVSCSAALHMGTFEYTLDGDNLTLTLPQTTGPLTLPRADAAPVPTMPLLGSWTLPTTTVAGLTTAGTLTFAVTPQPALWHYDVIEQLTCTGIGQPIVATVSDGSEIDTHSVQLLGDVYDSHAATP